MKKILILILALVVAGLTENAFSSVENNVQVTLTTQVNNNNHIRPPEKGNRKPSSPLISIVDFASGHIEVSTPTPIISYELWDEEGETSIAAYPSDSELVQFMTGLDGVYQLRLVTDEYIYIGYIEL